ncbi:MAG TPA: FAD-dependent oxidoreductase, partial [Baekduia sp.]|nr:FAD-dependent oxidoreductase [Baekduia sp.]
THDVRAAYVVLATHLPFLDQGGFFARCHPEREYAMAVALEGTVPRGMYISAEQPSRSVRQHPFDDGELLILAGESHKTGQDDDTEARFDALAAFAHERFEVRGIDFRWSTQDYMPVDRVPFIGPLRRGTDRLYVATAFQKWGMTNGTAAGIVLADRILGRDNAWSALFDPARITPRASAKEFVKENVNVARRFVQDRVTQRSGIDPDELAPGEGAVVRDGLRQVAVSRAGDGTLQRVSARCTHMGCIVRWNPAERSWDCPCHGSRFAADGAVLEGPAVDRLEPESGA